MATNPTILPRGRDRMEATTVYEQGLIGAVLRNPGAIDEVSALLLSEDFREDAHQRIWRAVLRVAQAGKTVDLVSVAQSLDSAKDTVQIGGYTYLAELFDSSWAGADVLRYAEQVKEASLLRSLAFLGQEIVQLAESSNAPCRELIAEIEKKLFALAEVGILGTAVHISDGLTSALDLIDSRTRTLANAAGIQTGLADLDEVVVGFQPGSLVIVAARPSVGKTAFALALLRNISSRGTPVFFASLEQSTTESCERLLVAASGVDGHKVKHGACTNDELRRIDSVVPQLRSLPVYLDDSPAQTVLRIGSNARRLARKKQLGMVVIDYLQLIEPENRKIPRHEQVADISRRLKQLARELNVPIITLAQLNREVENRADGRPRLSDLRESGQIEADADVVILLHRERDDPSNTMELIVAKHRNGQTGEVDVTFDRARMQITDCIPARQHTPFE